MHVYVTLASLMCGRAIKTQGVSDLPCFAGEKLVNGPSTHHEGVLWNHGGSLIPFHAASLFEFEREHRHTTLRERGGSLKTRSTAMKAIPTIEYPCRKNYSHQRQTNERRMTIQKQNMLLGPEPAGVMPLYFGRRTA